jgi:hypothetical protein
VIARGHGPVAIGGWGCARHSADCDRNPWQPLCTANDEAEREHWPASKKGLDGDLKANVVPVAAIDDRRSRTRQAPPSGTCSAAAGSAAESTRPAANGYCRLYLAVLDLPGHSAARSKGTE